MLRCYQSPQVGVHFFCGPYYEYAGFGSGQELAWFNDSRVMWKDGVAASVVTATRARQGSL